MVEVKKEIRRFVNALGFDVLRLSQSPQRTMLGLRSRNIRSIVDCGANEGQFARAMSEVFPKAKIYCFEPLKSPFEKLLAWSKTQDGRVTCFNLALGDVEGEVDMHCHDGHTPSSSLLVATAHCHELYPQTSTESTSKVQLRRLDHALADYLDNMPREIMLKLDVQGFEDRVLRGAMNLLAESSVCVLEVSLDPLYEEQANFFELHRLLKGAGYRYAGNLDQVCAEDGRVVYLDAVFLKDRCK